MIRKSEVETGMKKVWSELRREAETGRKRASTAEDGVHEVHR
jgi:hypothetical protein